MLMLSFKSRARLKRKGRKMIISCIGDSLTEGDYGIPGQRGIANVQDENYPYFLSKIMNAEVRNFGKSGFRSTDILKYYEEGNIDVTGSDKVIVMLGTNGGMDRNEELEGNEDYRKIIRKVRKDAPGAEIYVCTPPHVTENPGYSNCGYIGLVEKAVDFVRKYAKENDVKLIDVAECPYFTAETEHIYQPNDGLHYGAAGYEKMAEYIADAIK